MGNDGGEQHRLCGGLFGCGDTGGRGYRVEPDAVEAIRTPTEFVMTEPATKFMTATWRPWGPKASCATGIPMLPLSNVYSSAVLPKVIHPLAGRTRTG